MVKEKNVPCFEMLHTCVHNRLPLRSSIPSCANENASFKLVLAIYGNGMLSVLDQEPEGWVKTPLRHGVFGQSPKLTYLTGLL